MNYGEYRFSGFETVIYLAAGALIDVLVAWTFYRESAAFFIFLIPVEWIFLREVKKTLAEKRKYEFSLEFREAILSVQASLVAGYSVENAFIDTQRVMENMYGESIITKEFRILTRRLRSNEPLEKILLDMAERSGIEDIEDFANVFSAAKRSGGDFTRIIRRAVDSISDKMDVRRDIRTAISAKKYENRIMEAVPFGIIVYLNISSAGFLSPLYHNIKGAVVMTICLGLYGTGFALAEHILSQSEKV